MLSTINDVKFDNIPGNIWEATLSVKEPVSRISSEFKLFIEFRKRTKFFSTMS